MQSFLCAICRSAVPFTHLIRCFPVFMNLVVSDGLQGQELRTVILPHPRTGDHSLFLAADDGSVHEAVRFNRTIGCLFVGDSVIPDPSLVIVTSVDPLFLLLPNLTMHQKQFRSVDDIFSESCDFLKNLAQKSVEQLDYVCDTQVVDDEKFVRLSLTKTMTLLQHKVDTVVSILQQKGVSTSTLSSGLDRLKFLGKSDSNQADRVLYACGMVADYLPPQIGQKLRSHLQIEDETADNSSMRQSESGPSDSALNGKSGPREDYFVDAKFGIKAEEPKLTRSQKQLAKGDRKGIRLITSCFSKNK